MRAVSIALLHFIRSFLRSRQAVALEIVALRHQLAVLRRQTKRPRLTSSDRILWSHFSGSGRNGNRPCSS